MRGTVDSIKERLDIVEVVSNYLKLEKAGQNYKGKCPFHNEKTASFMVSPSRQSYYCFGCGAKGDIFTITEELEGVDFKGALKLLADKAGIQIEYTRGESKPEKDKLYSALEDAASFFESELLSNVEARTYIVGRGITEETIKDWRLGFAPAEWRTLYNHLKNLGYTKEILLKAGLIKAPDDALKEPYDVFRNRIIFPLFDPSGKVIAFSGRAMDKDALAKYLNTPETSLFQKSEVLYGLDRAKDEIRKKNFTILVEGQIDLVLSHQAGIKNTVASSGTAFTSYHLERLKRLSPRILLAFDGDEAGLKAGEKSTILGLELGMEVKTARLPLGKDPADLIRVDPEKFKEVLRTATHSIEDVLQRILETEKDQRKSGKLILKKVLPLLTLLESSIERAHFISLISKRSGIREEILWEDLRQTDKPTAHQAQEKEENTKIKTKENAPRKTHIERRLVGILIWQKTLTQPSIQISELEDNIKRIAGEEYTNVLIETLEQEREALMFEAESYAGTDLIKDISELLDNLTDDCLREELSEKIKELGKAESEKDEQNINRITNEIQGIHTRMRELEEKRKIV